jgi:hypothetical protein
MLNLNCLQETHAPAMSVRGAAALVQSTLLHMQMVADHLGSAQSLACDCSVNVAM